MVELRLWWLSLPKHAHLPDGVPINGTREQEADRMWGIYGNEAEEMKPGLHDLTPPTLRGMISTHLMVHSNFHGIHKIDDSRGRIRLLRESTLKYMNSPDGIAIVRLLEDTHDHNVAFVVGNGPTNLYYILRWLQSPTQTVDRSRRELVAAGVGIG